MLPGLRDAGRRGDYGTGTYYFRNPPGSGYTPLSKDGRTLFVKLDQFAPDDTKPVRIDTKNRLCHR